MSNKYLWCKIFVCDYNPTTETKASETGITRRILKGYEYDLYFKLL